MSDERRGPRRKTEPDERLYDERVRFVRPGRLIAGLVMIAVAVIWLVVENLFGGTPKQANPGAIATPTPSSPMLGTVQSFPGGTANALVQARPSRLNGHAAPKGSSFLVIAVQVKNHGASPLRVRAGDITLHVQGRNLGAGTIHPGHGAVFASAGIPPGGAAEGDLDFMVRNPAKSMVLEYLPHVPHAVMLSWAIPPAR
ncbi:MAG: hypothetical protein ACRDG4_04245 [Chloroflexota bacterium]